MFAGCRKMSPKVLVSREPFQILQDWRWLLQRSPWDAGWQPHKTTGAWLLHNKILLPLPHVWHRVPTSGLVSTTPAAKTFRKKGERKHLFSSERFLVFLVMLLSESDSWTVGFKKSWEELPHSFILLCRHVGAGPLMALWIWPSFAEQTLWRRVKDFLHRDKIQCLVSLQKCGNIFHRWEKAILLKEKGAFSD